MSILIATTRAGDLQALGTAGQLTTDSWSALHQLLGQRLGPAHAALLTEPVTNAAQGETDWYADATGPVQPLSSLAPQSQDAARARLGQLTSEVAALASSMDAAGSGSDRFLAALLRLAMQVPDAASVFMAGDQPLLVSWGHTRAGASGDSAVLTGTRAAAAGPVVILPPPPSPQPIRRRYGPALVASLLVALLCLAASAYVVGRDPFGWYAVTQAACQRPEADLTLRGALQHGADRESELRLQLAQLSTDAGSRRLMCPPIQQAAAPVPTPTLPPRSADETRAQERGGQQGKLTLILAWDDRNDLDLRVACPDGNLVFFGHHDACSGRLDVDANGDARTADAQPVENMFFGDPPPGLYRVIVDPYAMRVARSTPFRLTVKQEGRPDRVIDGVATLGQRLQEVTTVTVGGPP